MLSCIFCVYADKKHYEPTKTDHPLGRMFVLVSQWTCLNQIWRDVPPRLWDPAFLILLHNIPSRLVLNTIDFAAHASRVRFLPSPTYWLFKWKLILFLQAAFQMRNIAYPLLQVFQRLQKWRKCIFWVFAYMHIKRHCESAIPGTHPSVRLSACSSFSTDLS